MEITVVLPTYNPNPERLAKALRGLESQTISPCSYSLVLVDNASEVPVDEDWCASVFSGHMQVIREPELGLSKARLAGVLNSATKYITLCDDDNVLSPSYLEHAIRLMEENPKVGVAGGRNFPVFDQLPPSWYHDGIAPLGCRDLGEDAQYFHASDYVNERRYAGCAPVGAGMVLRRGAISSWEVSVSESGVTDRKGGSLSSAGDCDMVLHALGAGWSVAYWPELYLEHLIPSSRICKTYLSKVARCAYRDFVKVLDLHSIRPWPAIRPWTLRLRNLKIWLKFRPWRSPNAFIKYHSIMGQYEGRALLSDRGGR